MMAIITTILVSILVFVELALELLSVADAKTAHMVSILVFVELALEHDNWRAA